MKSRRCEASGLFLILDRGNFLFSLFYSLIYPLSGQFPYYASAILFGEIYNAKVQRVSGRQVPLR